MALAPPAAPRYSYAAIGRTRPLSEPEITAAQEARWAEAQNGPVVLLDPLPRKVRLRLWFTGRINDLGYWLVVRGHIGAARRLWRI